MEKPAKPRLEDHPGRTIVGVRGQMSLVEDRTPQLWRSFMPRRREVKNRTGSDYLSVRVYRGTGPDMFAPSASYEKWAAVEVESSDGLPEGMESHALAGGKYAVFEHRGPASTFPDTFRYIFMTWLPSSGFQLDDREHFEILPEDYDPADPDAHEEIWVPIR